MTFNCDFVNKGRHTIMKAFGEIHLQNIEEISDILWKAINEADNSLIIDLSELDYIDSSGIGILVNANKKMVEKKGEFALLGVRDELMRVLKISELEKYFTIYKSESTIPD